MTKLVNGMTKLVNSMAKLLNKMNKLIKKKRVKKKYTSVFQQPVEVNVPQLLQRSLLP